MSNAVIPAGAAALIPTDMNSAMALANMMANGKLVPGHLQKSPGDCLMVIEQAMRWRMSPFAVAQSTSVIQGKLMFEGKLVAAALSGSGLLASRMAYTFEGEGPSRAVVASAVMVGESDPRTIRCTLAEAKTNNGMWTKQPDQQLVYFSTRAWARRHCPEVMLGVYSPEEFDDPREAKPADADGFRGTTIDATAEPAPTEDRAKIGAETLARQISEAPDLAALEAITGNADIVKKRAWLVKNRIELADLIDLAVNDKLAAFDVVEDAPTAPDDDGVFPGDRP